MTHLSTQFLIRLLKAKSSEYIPGNSHIAKDLSLIFKETVIKNVNRINQISLRINHKEKTNVFSSEYRELLKELNEAARMINRDLVKIEFLIEFELVREHTQKYDIQTEGSVAKIIYDIATEMCNCYSREMDLLTDIADGTLSMRKEDLIAILKELIDNALRYSSVGDKVKIETAVDDQYYIIEITDFGNGMSENQVDILQKEVMDVSHINGLGLFLVKHITESYAGRFNIFSIPYRTKVVTLLLPMAPKSRNLNVGQTPTR